MIDEERGRKLLASVKEHGALRVVSCLCGACTDLKNYALDNLGELHDELKQLRALVAGARKELERPRSTLFAEACDARDAALAEVAYLSNPGHDGLCTACGK